jgi:dTDP-4-amino-4,6-dideoxygalactose transaminase
MILYSTQNIEKKDKNEVVKALGGSFLTQGPEIDKFESNIKKYLKVNYCTVVNSATSALHLSLMALGVTKKDYVWTSSITFVATSNVALHLGAKVDFVDIDSETFNICVEKLEKKLIAAKKQQKLPKVLIIVHLGGEPCDLSRLYKLKKKYGFSILEDAAHAFGSKYKNHMVGNCIFSDLACFSFHPLKIITTGEGGAITTRNKKIYNKLKALKSHGIEKNIDEKKSKYIFNYKQNYLGLNYRLTDIQAALGNSQLRRIEKKISIRRKIANYYKKNLNSDIQIQKYDLKNRNSYHLFIVKIPIKKLRISTQKIIYTELLKRGIQTNIHYIPTYLQPYYQKIGFKNKKYKEADIYFKSALSLPIHDNLNNIQLEKVVKYINLLTKIN